MNSRKTAITPEVTVKIRDVYTACIQERKHKRRTKTQTLFYNFRKLKYCQFN